MSYEKINHPNHYNWIPNIECFDVVRHFPFNLGCAIKHIWRAGRKPGVDVIEDLEKAVTYLQDEIKWRKKQKEDGIKTQLCAGLTTEQAGQFMIDEAREAFRQK